MVMFHMANYSMVFWHLKNMKRSAVVRVYYSPNQDPVFFSKEDFTPAHRMSSYCSEIFWNTIMGI